MPFCEGGAMERTRYARSWAETDGPDFDIDLYHPEGIEDELGDGFRLYTLDDAVYEARTRPLSIDMPDVDVPRIDTRIYTEEGDWMLKANVPVTEKKPAYQTLRFFADAVEEVEGTELESTWLEYQTAYEDGDAFTVETRDRAVSFRHDGDIDIPTVHYNGWEGITTGANFGAMLGGVAALAGNVVGMPMDPFNGLMMGWMAGSGVGGVGSKARQFRTNRKRRKKYGDVDGLEELDVFDRMNEKNRLEAVLNRSGPAPDRFTERYNELREDEFEDIFDTVTTAHFEGFDEQAGVTLTGRFDTYTDAYGMAAELVAVEAAGEHPSIYADADVFRHLFSFFTYEECGEEHLLEDGERLLQEVMRRDDVDQSIITWLDEEYTDMVRDVGQKHTLEDGRDGG